MRAFFISLLIVLGLTSHAHARVLDCDKNRKQSALVCMACNIYHEARYEPQEGKLMVGLVTLERVKDERFPRSVCRVVWQKTRKCRRCRWVAQFSWTRDRLSDVVWRKDIWEESMAMARYLIHGTESDKFNLHAPDMNHEGVLWYHADYVNPRWNKRFSKVITIGRHMFYREAPVEIEMIFLGDDSKPRFKPCGKRCTKQKHVAGLDS